MTKPLNIGLIGYGFMGRTHSNAYRQVSKFFDLEYQPVLKACCARNEEKIKEFAENWGWESYETDWRKLIARDDIDAIDIGSPNNTHYEMALAAAEAGKMILCEKPLAMDVAQAEAMTAAVEKAGVANMVWYNYRRVPAITLAHQLVKEGRIGRPFHYRATYLQDWTIAEDVPQGGATLWRLDAAVAGSGVTGDLLAHSIDTAIWLNGPITSVSAATETFVKERMHQDTGEMQPVSIDDACMFLARFENGSMGTFESSRYARGRKNYNTFEMNGEDGSVFFDLEDPQILQFFEYANPTTGKKVEDHLTGWRRIHVTNFEHPYMDRWWVPGCTIGYEHTFTNALSDFLKGLETGEPAQPTFRDALQTQKICDAVLESARERIWIDID
ncbi:1,5-anhydro-D-fructose reductase [Symmachiella macrocystis]|uniref:1,5-anhydro-D-fructose reductase n=1 Tax=Symmachiella macrocystis TaxID=2527985 RepID=A0A5C6BTN3_9PLAN|nr:Gfo/Idh/MocA family oxidoreductase [Symmachiella macrocystis]TWU14199.1 1,5-anhydro-D-fructose reductase [Symmachiella macrocystis]